MPTVSPKLGEFLVKTTKARDIDDAFERIFVDYLDLKLRSLDDTIKGFQAKWNMDFGTFREKSRAGALDQSSYSFDVEQDFWEWEEVETLRNHYMALKEEWM